MAATIWKWSGETLSQGALFAVLYFSSCHFFCRLDFPSLPLSAPGSPRMLLIQVMGAELPPLPTAALSCQTKIPCFS